jgi:hypothetical protein
MATKGYAAPEVEQTYARARALCAQVGDTPQLLPTLRGLWGFYHSRGALPTARELGEQRLSQAQRVATPTPRLAAHEALGITLFYLGEYAAARAHLQQGIALTEEVPLTKTGGAHAPELDELYDALVYGKPVLPSGRWGLATLEVCLAIMQSATAQRDIPMQHQVAVPDGA